MERLRMSIVLDENKNTEFQAVGTLKTIQPYILLWFENTEVQREVIFPVPQEE